MQKYIFSVGKQKKLIFIMDMAMKKISAILIGAGNRGKVYTDDIAKYPEPTGSGFFH